MIIKKSSGDLDILDSGSLLAFSATSDLEFEVQLDETFSFDLFLKFASNGGDQPNTKSDVEGNKIIITCINFDNVLGTGTSSPIELAVFEGKKIYINFWVYGLGKKSARKVSYTFYKER